MHHLSGVHPVVGVEDRFDLFEEGDDLGSEHPGQQLAAGLAVAMLTGQRAAVGDDQVRGAFDEGPVVRDSIPGAHLERDPGVDAALAEVPVQRGLRLRVAEVVEQCAEVAEVVPEAFGRHGGILPAFPGLVLPGGVGSRTETGLADLDQRFLFGGVIEELDVRGVFGALEVVEQGLRPSVGVVGVLAGELDHQPGAPGR